MLGRIEHDLARCGRHDGSAQQRTDADQQLRDVEGFGHVVVGARLEAAHLVMQAVQGGQHQHRHVHAARPEGQAHIASVGVRKPQIQDDQLRWCRCELLQQTLGRDGDGDAMAVELQGTPEDAADRRVVFAHHDESHALTLDTPVPVLHPP